MSPENIVVYKERMCPQLESYEITTHRLAKLNRTFIASVGGGVGGGIGSNIRPSPTPSPKRGSLLCAPHTHCTKDTELLAISQFAMYLLPSVLSTRTFKKVRKLDTELWATTWAGTRTRDNLTTGIVRKNVSYHHHHHSFILNLNFKVNYSDKNFSPVERHHIGRERESGNRIEFRNCWQKIHRKTTHILQQQKGYTSYRNRLTS